MYFIFEIAFSNIEIDIELLAYVNTNDFVTELIDKCKTSFDNISVVLLRFEYDTIFLFISDFIVVSILLIFKNKS